MKMSSNSITELYHGGYTSQQRDLSFKPGQILNGKILKLFPNNMATLQIGSQKVVAQLEASLVANEKYWFQVQSGEGKVRLKVMGRVENTGHSEVPIAGLMKELSIPVNKENTGLVRFFLQENLPISKEILHHTVGLLKESNMNQTGLEAIKVLLMKEIPLTKTTFYAVIEVLKKESFTQNLYALQDVLEKSPLTKEGSQLIQFFDRLRSSQPHEQLGLLKGSNQGLNDQVPLIEDKNGMSPLNKQIENINFLPSDRSSFVEYFKGLIKSIGFSYENEVIQFLKHPDGKDVLRSEALKPLLIDFLKENPTGTAKDIAEKILHKITGIQLFAQESGPIQQLVVQLPVSLWEKQVDVTMQWSGRKKENGQIDPSFCRVLFYLELETLQDTIIDMQVQNRIMKLTVMNGNEQLKQLAHPFINQLKENLKSINYTLSNVHFTHLSDQKKEENKQPKTYFESNHYSGVDVRI